MAIVVKECVGIKISKFEDRNTHKEIETREIFYIEPFPDDKDVVGMACGSLRTASVKTDLKVGDKFKAYYDSQKRWNPDLKKFVDVPVLVDLVIVNPK